MLRSSLARTVTRATSSPAVSIAKRNHMSVSYGRNILVPCDPYNTDASVIYCFNWFTESYEPIVVPPMEWSFEWLHTSPIDLHLFDVLPVVKDCIDIEADEHEVEGMAGL